MRFDIRIGSLSDRELLGGLFRVVGRDRKNQSHLLAYLAEVERRKLYAEKGYSCLYRYVREELGYSEDAAMKRIQASRLAMRFPLAYELLEDGKTHLSTLCRLSRHLNEENAERLLLESSGRSVREVEWMIAREFPKALVPDKVRQTASPLSVDKFHVQFTTNSEFVELLEKAKARLSTKYPEGRLEDIFRQALTTLVEQKTKQKDRLTAAGQVPLRKVPKAPTTTHIPCPEELEFTPRYIPKNIQQEVWERDEGKCQFKSHAGKICGETKFLQYDHVLAWSLGGSSRSTQNIRLLCATHNKWISNNRFRLWQAERDTFLLRITKERLSERRDSKTSILPLQGLPL